MFSGARRRGLADSLRRRFSHRQNKCRRDEAERTGDEEGREIRRIFRANQTSAERRTGGTNLVAGKHPPEHHAGLLRAEAVGRQFHGRRYGGDPIETVEHSEQRKAVEREIGEGQVEQRKAAQPVIPEQQPAIVEAVGQPAGADGAEEVENAHHREHARRGHRRQAIVVAQRDEMGLNQSIGAATADEERAEQYPEDWHARRVLEHIDGRHQQRNEADPFGRPWRDLALAIERQIEVARPVVHQQRRDKRDKGQHAGHENERRAPAQAGGEFGDQRQKYELTGRTARRQHTDDDAAAMVEPTSRHRRRQNHRGQPGPDADHDAPQQNELPHLRHRQ